MMREHEIRFGPLYAVCINPNTGGERLYAASAGEPGATTTDIRSARKFSTVPDAVLWIETYRERFPRDEPQPHLIDRDKMAAMEASAGDGIKVRIPETAARNGNGNGRAKRPKARSGKES